jgi:hypothetical protein
MTESNPNPRLERITRLLEELRYEIEVGMIQREIEEEMSYRFIVPLSKTAPDGVVFCEFRTEPTSRYALGGMELQPRLRIIK